MSIIDKAIGLGSKIVKIASHNAPTIALIGGSAAVITGGFLACKATLKAESILDEHRARIDMTVEARKANPDNYTEQDQKHDKLQIYFETAGKFARLYGSSILLSTAGFAAIFGGFGLIKKRYGIALSTIASLDERFASYRKAVINEFGQEVDERITKQRGDFTVVETKSIDENGEEITEEIEAIKFDNIYEDDFTRIFDSSNPKWENDFLLNDNFLNTTINWYTKNLQSRRMDHVFMNTILKDFGFEETGLGHFYGWMSKPGCCVNVKILPFIKLWDRDVDEQFPMMIPITDDAGYESFREAYINDPNSVGYILKFMVDADENGVPREIYHDVFKESKTLAKSA